MKNRRILIVDDHAAVRRSLETFLREMFPQADVMVAQSGRQALDLVAATPPDVVLLDAKMPHLDGMDTTREIKSRWPSTRVIALVLDLDQRDKALEAGADGWLQKGCSTEHLVNVLQVGRREGGGTIDEKARS